VITTTVKFMNRFSAKDLDLKSCLLIFDRKLKNQAETKKVIAKFPLRYGVDGGERLKNIKGFPEHAEHILKILHAHNQKDLKIVVLGGGSVGDFAGFFASVLKRGTDLVLIPTTWLAAIDSAHGGKNGLNAGGFKNQIGSFYQPQSVYLVRDILLNQPDELMLDACGELFKIALISGGSLWKKVRKHNTFSALELWSFLPLAIRSKYQIVRQDPLEKRGYRQILNFGHTFGHIIESQLGVTHGRAVGQGLVFATEWSLNSGFLGPKQYEGIAQCPFYVDFSTQLKSSLKKLSAHKVRAGLQMDKKKSQKDELIFILPIRPGLCIRHKVKVKQVEKFFELQKKSGPL
jgi:3-dehydroquinate synthase